MTNLHILVPAITRGTLARPHELKRNPVEFQSVSRHDRSSQDDRKGDKNSSKLFKTHRKNPPRVCVYCDSTEHKCLTCPTVTSAAERRSVLLQKRLCYNCTGLHKVIECYSKISCQNCNKKHHTSICEVEQTPEGMLTAHQIGESEVVYPVVLIEGDGIKTRALLGNPETSSWTSSSSSS